MATHTTGHDAAHGHGGHGHHPSDRVPAFVGLIGGGAFVGAVLYGVVLWTNAQFAGHEREKGPVATAEAPGATAPGAAAPGEAPPAAGGAAGVAAAASGTTHEVKMLGDAQGYRFEPANFTVKTGDVVKFVNVSGGPHNAAFDPAEVPDDVEAVLSKNMPNQMSTLAGPLLVNPNETYSISFADVKAGAYNYHCTPHIAMNMKGVITVQ
jgi:plastocyanin